MNPTRHSPTGIGSRVTRCQRSLLVLLVAAPAMGSAAQWRFDAQSEADGKCWVRHGGLAVWVLPPRSDGTPDAARAREVVRRLNSLRQKGMLGPDSVDVATVDSVPAVVVRTAGGALSLILTADGRSADYYRLSPVSLAAWWRDLLCDHLLIAAGQTPVYVAKHYPSNVLVEFAKELRAAAGSGGASGDPDPAVVRKYAGELSALPLVGPAGADRSTTPVPAVSSEEPAAPREESPAGPRALAPEPAVGVSEGLSLSHVVAGQLIELSLDGQGPTVSRLTELRFSARTVQGEELPIAKCESRVYLSRVGGGDVAELTPSVTPTGNGCRVTCMFTEVGEHIVSLWLRYGERRLNVNFPVTVGSAPAAPPRQATVPQAPATASVSVAETTGATLQQPTTSSRDAGGGLAAALPQQATSPLLVSTPDEGAASPRVSPPVPELASPNTGPRNGSLLGGPQQDTPGTEGTERSPASARPRPARPAVTPGVPQKVVVRPVLGDQRLLPAEVEAQGAAGAGPKPVSVPRPASPPLGVRQVPGTPVPSARQGTPAAHSEAQPSRRSPVAADSLGTAPVAPRRDAGSAQLRTLVPKGSIGSLVPAPEVELPSPVAPPVSLRVVASHLRPAVAQTVAARPVPVPLPAVAAEPQEQEEVAPVRPVVGPTAEPPTVATRKQQAPPRSVPGVATAELAQTSPERLETSTPDPTQRSVPDLLAPVVGRRPVKSFPAREPTSVIGPVAIVEVAATGETLPLPPAGQSPALASPPRRQRPLGSPSSTTVARLATASQAGPPEAEISPAAPAAGTSLQAPATYRVVWSPRATRAPTLANVSGEEAVALPQGERGEMSPAGETSGGAVRAAVRTEPTRLLVGRRALLEVTLTEAVQSTQGVMVSAPVEASRLLASVVHSGSSGHGAAARPMAPRERIGVYLLYQFFRAPGRYELHLLGARSSGEEISLTVPLEVAVE